MERVIILFLFIILILIYFWVILHQSYSAYRVAIEKKNILVIFIQNILGIFTQNILGIFIQTGHNTS